LVVSSLVLAAAASAVCQTGPVRTAYKPDEKWQELLLGYNVNQLCLRKLVRTILL